MSMLRSLSIVRSQCQICNLAFLSLCMLPPFYNCKDFFKFTGHWYVYFWRQNDTYDGGLQICERDRDGKGEVLKGDSIKVRLAMGKAIKISVKMA